MKMMTMTELLDDTIEYYSKDPAVYRSVVEYGNNSDCVYTNDEGQHCAVGRWLREEYQNNEWDYNGDNGVDAIQDMMDTLMVDEVRDIPTWLWSRLQSLHDMRENWDYNNKSLTTAGHIYAEKIRDEIESGRV